MKKIVLFLCASIMLGLMPVKAQKVWSLEECIMYALENNLNVKQQDLNVEVSKNNLTQSYFNTLPNLNGQFSHGYGVGTLTYQGDLYPNSTSWTGNTGVTSSLTLFNGLQTLNDIKLKKYLFLQSQSILEKQRNDISISLSLAYLQVLFSKELVEVANSKLEVTSLQTERTRKMFEVGNVAQGELLQIKAQEANDKTTLVTTQSDLDLAILNLTQLLDLDSTAGFNIVIPQNIEVEIASTLESIQQIYAISVAYMPQIKSAEYALLSAEKQLAISRGMISPSINLSGGYTSDYYIPMDLPDGAPDPLPFRDQIKNNKRTYVNMGLSIPIFNNLQVKTAIDNSKINLENAKLELELAKMALYKEIQQAHTDATAAREKYYQNVEAVSYNEEAFKYTTQKMEVGLVNSVDYNVSQNNLIKAKSDMLRAKYEYIFKLKILDLYMNKPITL